MPTIVNPEEQNFYSRQFNVVLAHLLPTLHVYADSAGDALDEVADWALEQGWDLILTGDDYTEAVNFDEVSYVGNAGTPISSNEISIVDVTGDDWSGLRDENGVLRLGSAMVEICTIHDVADPCPECEANLERYGKNWAPAMQYQIETTHGEKVGAPFADPEDALIWLGEVYQTDGLYSDNAGRIRTLQDGLTRWNLLEIEIETDQPKPCPECGVLIEQHKTACGEHVDPSDIRTRAAEQYSGWANRKF